MVLRLFEGKNHVGASNTEQETQKKSGARPSKPVTAVEIAMMRKAAREGAATLEKRLGKERVESLLLEGLKGEGAEVTPEWWEKFQAEIAEEARKGKRRSCIFDAQEKGRP